MIRPENQALVGQNFKSEDDIPLPSLSTHLCAESGKRFVYWKDIEAAFDSVFYLLDSSDERLLFMIDDNAELHIPLRIEHDPDDDYTVVYVDGEGLQLYNYIQSPQSDIYRDQGNTLIRTPMTLFAPLERLFTTTKYLFDRIKLTPNAARSTFLQLVANARHYHVLLVNEIQNLDEFGFRAQFPGTEQTSVLTRVQRLDEQVPEWDYRNICFNMFYGGHGKWDYATSKLFVVLPSDLESWDDNNPSTHQFRLYFLCDNSMDVLAKRGMPQHVHLSNHPGYILKQPQEFFKKYGDYVLRLMQLVRLGYSDNAYDIPAIDTFNILWKYKTHAGGNINRDTIRSLIEKAIAYIQKVSPPRWIMEPGLTRIQSAAIKDFLLVQHGDNAEGNLHRHIDSQQCVSWRCQRHKEQYFTQKLLEALKAHVGCKRGHVDMQQARLSVELRSYTESIGFQRLLTNIRMSFNLSMKLNWNTTRTYVEKLCQDVAQLKTVALDIDGVTPSIYPQGYVHYTRNIFVDKVLPETGLQLITLVNYPRPHQQCIHLGNFSLRSRLAPTRSSHSWVDLRTDLDRVWKRVSEAQEAFECKAAVAELLSVQEKHGLSDTTSITFHSEKWAAVFNLKERAVIEAYSHDAECPWAVRSSGSLRQLTIDLSDLEFDKEFFQVLEANPGLQYLNVAYHGKRVFSYIEHLIKSWRESPSPYCLTLVDRLEDSRGRIVAQMTVQRPDSGTLDADHMSSSARKGKQIAPPIRFEKWEEDQASIRTDYHAVFLDMATLQHPSSLRLLTVDTSQLSGDGLDSIRNVLRQSRLEHLSLVCKPVDPTLSQSVSDVLRAIPWGTLKSLVLFGNDTNGVLELCPTPEEPRLLGLQIQGTGPAPQELAHSSALLIHHLASESSLEKMEIKDVKLQHPSDWIVIVDAVDPVHLKKIDLCKNCMSQLRSNTDAAVLYDSKFKTSAGAKARALVAKAGSLEDVFAPSSRKTPHRTQYPVSQTPIAAYDIPDEAQTSVVMSEAADDTGTQTSVATSEMSDDEETQTSIATSDMASDAETLAPCSPSEMTSDMETQAADSLSEMAGDMETQRSSIVSEMAGNAETQAPSVSSEIAGDMAIQTVVGTPEISGDIVTQTVAGAFEVSDDSATHATVGKPEIFGTVTIRTTVGAPRISNNPEARTAVATPDTSCDSEPQMLNAFLPTNNDTATPDGLADSQKAKTKKASRWRR
ncbi:hypothetical protein BGZ82_000465, partial [Podila clonocystis]